LLRIKPILPLVSVIIPVYNQEKYIQECVESVINQDYKKIEIIVVDDGSTDGTADILKSFGDQIKYIRQENQGPAASVNTGIKTSKGSLICWFGSDDVYMTNKISEQVDFLLKEPSISIAYSDYIMIDSNGSKLMDVQVPYPPFEQFARSLLIRNFINGSTVIMRKECIDAVGDYDETLRADPDGDMWFRMLKHGYRFGHISKPLVKYRWHSSNVSKDQELMRECKDKVRLKVLSGFTPNELFGDIISAGGSLEKSYEEMALHLFRNFNFRAAEKALFDSRNLADSKSINL